METFIHTPFLSLSLSIMFSLSLSQTHTRHKQAVSMFVAAVDAVLPHTHSLCNAQTQTQTPKTNTASILVAGVDAVLHQTPSAIFLIACVSCWWLLILLSPLSTQTHQLIHLSHLDVYICTRILIRMLIYINRYIYIYRYMHR